MVRSNVVRLRANFDSSLQKERVGLGPGIAAITIMSPLFLTTEFFFYHFDVAGVTSEKSEFRMDFSVQMSGTKPSPERPSPERPSPERPSPERPSSGRVVKADRSNKLSI